ncbi:MAG: hypothetical protein ACYTG5_13860, partial [Planctomycetota bacterium]
MGKLIEFLSSFKLSVAILFGLFILTWLGTLAQVEMGLHGAQKKYFDSWFLIQPLFWTMALPLPGGFLLMLLLVINLTCGGIVRLRKRWDRLGILITHLGIAFLLLAGFVKMYYANEGPLQLFEGQEKSEYSSYYAWEIQLVETLNEGGYREYVIPEEDFVGFGSDRKVTFGSDELPFDLVVHHFMPNCQPAQKGPMFTVNVPVVDGFYLREMAPSTEAEANLAGVYVAVVDPTNKNAQEAILWAGEGGMGETMFGFDAGGTRWGAVLRKKRWPLPFSVQLEYTEKQEHPGTTMPRSFLSDVVVTDAGVTQKARIQM